jgi:hypothetical protein
MDTERVLQAVVENQITFSNDLNGLLGLVQRIAQQQADLTQSVGQIAEAQREGALLSRSLAENQKQLLAWTS